ncbi:MAG: PEGA domain-containing protein [Patescibacteria group bacterium]
MQLKYRRFIYLSFIVLFIIAAILLLLFAQGYSYNHLKGRVERTGALEVLSKPKGANIIVDSKPLPNTTPFTISRLSPDLYNITIELEGYQRWNKKIAVKGGRASSTNEVKLWPSEQTGTLLPDTSNISIYQSPNHHNLLYISSQGLGVGLWLYNLSSGESALLKRPANQPVEEVEWAPNNRRLLIKEQTSDNFWQVFNLTDNTIRSIAPPGAVVAQKMHWSSNDQDLIYFTAADELYEFSLNTNTAKLLWREQIVDFRHHSGLIFALVKQGKDGIGLKILNPKNLQVVPFDQPIPPSTNFRFLKAKGDWLPLLDTSRHVLHLLRSPLKSFKPIITLPDVVNIDWSDDGSRLLITNNFEIWQFQPAEERLDLIYRVSSTLSQARWFNNDYVLLASENELQSLELDTRDQQQRWLLTKQTKPIQNFFLDPLGEMVTVHTETGLVRLPLITTLNPLNALPVNSP